VELHPIDTVAIDDDIDAVVDKIATGPRPNHNLELVGHLGQIKDAAGQQGPVVGIKTALGHESLQPGRGVMAGVDGDCDEMDLGQFLRRQSGFHRFQRSQQDRADIDTGGIEERRHHHLALEIGQPGIPAVLILQHETGGGSIDLQPIEFRRANRAAAQQDQGRRQCPIHRDAPA